MTSLISVRLLFVSAFVLLLLSPHPLLAQSIYFEDHDDSVLILGNNDYEIGFHKTNGALVYIIDKQRGQTVASGSPNVCLWSAVSASSSIGGCDYQGDSANPFHYHWNAAGRTLTFTYDPASDTKPQMTSQTKIRASESSWFDIQLQVHSEWDGTLEYILFPADLTFNKADIEQVLLPALPGLMLERQFFTEDRNYIDSYPGGWFADYMALSTVNGQLAIYPLSDSGTIHPVKFGFRRENTQPNDSVGYYHAFGTNLKQGDSWLSPWMRFQIGQPLLTTIQDYRAHNGFEAFPSISDKLGQKYKQVVESPVFKADANPLNMPFSEYSSFLAQVPTPGIIHLVGFQPNGFDKNHPDFLPPDRKWGTTTDMASMIQQIQKRGFLVMSYTNPTWWTTDSATLQNLPSSVTIRDVAALDEQKNMHRERYNGQSGYLVSPYSPFVQQRLNSLNESMSQDIHSDLLFEDQLGARGWRFDYNAFSPTPTSYAQGWLDYTRNQAIPLMTEAGFDRLAETETGFHGSILLTERLGHTDRIWGAGNWHHYPFAPLLLRDKVLFYQHNLAAQTTTIDKETLLWNLAFGYMLTYDLGLPEALDNPWLGLVSSFQKNVIAQYATEKLINFEYLSPDMTQSSFENFIVLANWNEEAGLVTGPYTLPPLGFIGKHKDDRLVFGLFTDYNNFPLTGGDHFLIEERTSDTIIIRQPLGESTGLTVTLPQGWTKTDMITIQAHTIKGQIIDPIPLAVTDNWIRFIYKMERAGQPISYYEIRRHN